MGIEQRERRCLGQGRTPTEARTTIRRPQLVRLAGPAQRLPAVHGQKHRPRQRQRTGQAGTLAQRLGHAQHTRTDQHLSLIHI